jgi:outer membrane biosynthesis protein TonB
VKVTLTVTIDAEGNVSKVEPKAEKSASEILARSAAQNMQHWTFAKPPSAPYTQTVVYDYALSVDSPERGRVIFDLPDHVRIEAPVPIVQ